MDEKTFFSRYEKYRECSEDLRRHNQNLIFSLVSFALSSYMRSEEESVWDLLSFVSGMKSIINAHLTLSDLYELDSLSEKPYQSTFPAKSFVGTALTLGGLFYTYTADSNDPFNELCGLLAGHLLVVGGFNLAVYSIEKIKEICLKNNLRDYDVL